MHWLIRDGFSDQGYLNLLTALERLGYEYTLVKCIAFDDYNYTDLDGNPLPDSLSNKPVMVYGGQGLIDYAKHRGWYPGAYTNENFNVSIWQEHWKDELLNNDSIIGTMGDIIEPPYEHFFIRPLFDNKNFAGMLMHSDEYKSWRQKILAIPDDCYSTMNKDTLITIATIKHIIAEYRLFVVNGKVVTGSEYKRGDNVGYYEYLPTYILDYAQKVIDIWEPDQAYCLDIAEIGKEDGTYDYKVLEVNCINGCGLYASDVYKYAHHLSTIND